MRQLYRESPHLPIDGAADSIEQRRAAGEEPIQLVILILLAILIVWLVRILIKAGRERSGGVRRRVKRGPARATPARARGGQTAPGRAYGQPCPLCKNPLAPGEKVHSVVYSGPVESFVEVYGCPSCMPDKGEVRRTRATRTCPVCKQEIEADGYVVGRMYEKNGTKHLRILGCTRCRTVR